MRKKTMVKISNGAKKLYLLSRSVCLLGVGHKFASVLSGSQGERESLIIFFTYSVH